MAHSRFIILCSVFGFGLTTTTMAQSEAGRVQLIATGWDNPTPSQFREHLAEFERLPFQGTVIVPVRRQADGKVVPCQDAFDRAHWDWAELAPSVADLTAVKPTKAVSNFLTIYANPGNVDWFDDAGWDEIVDHWRLLARVAKQGGLKGLLFDAEPYSPPYQAFHYPSQAQKDKHAFSDYAVRSRERGRQVMKAVVAEYPDITIFTYRLLCDLLPAVATDHEPTPLLAANTYGLMPTFLDGWFDAMPATVTLVDGDENAYRFNSDAEFDRGYVDLTTRTRRLVAPENRARYRAQVQAGHGIYLDAHANPPGSPWYIDPKGSTPVARLEANVSSAVRTSDGYVWIYGEVGRWWPGGNPKFPHWSEKLPGIEQALALASDPIGAAQTLLAASGPDANRVRNGHFTDIAANSLPDRWWTWQDERSRGTFAHDAGAGTNGSARVSGCANGCFGQDLDVRPGELYAIRGHVACEGRGAAWLTVRWRDADHHWTAEAQDIVILPEPKAGTDGWRTVVGLVRVPPSAHVLVLLLSAQGQIDAHDAARFGDVAIVPFEAHVDNNVNK